MDCEAYISAAIARSYRNRGDAMASTEEYLGVLTRQFYGYYADAADQNPAVFAKRVLVPWNVSGYWEAPTDQYALYELTMPTGATVYVVPFNQRDAEPSEACVYRLGSVYYPAGNPNDPVNVNLTWTYQPVPPTFTALADEPPSEWPEQFDERVIVDLAQYLAEKDGRTDDIQTMSAEAGKWRQLWDRWLGVADTNTVRKYGMPEQVPTSQVQPIGVRGG